MISRLVDGRTALHLAAQYGLDGLIERMFERSKQNQGEAEKKARTVEDQDEDSELKDDSVGLLEGEPMDFDARLSSEDDWNSDENDGKQDHLMDGSGNRGGGHRSVEEDYGPCRDDDQNEGDGGIHMSKNKKEGDSPGGEVPEDEEAPDVLDINIGDWDQGLTPLGYAALYSTSSTISTLLRYHADPNLAAVPSGGRGCKNILPLFLTLVRPDEDTAVRVAECLIEGGASSSAVDENLTTVLHQAVGAGNMRILDVLLRKDPGAKKALDFPSVELGAPVFPVVSAAAGGKYAALLMLLAYGAKINPIGADVARARAIRFVSLVSCYSGVNAHFSCHAAGKKIYICGGTKISRIFRIGFLGPSKLR